MVHPATEFIPRDIGSNPPPLMSESWIAAAFTPTKARTGYQRAILEASETLIEELERSDVVVIATPMYNYGMPAALKAWFDQVIRVGRTFTFDLARGDWPLEPVLTGKSLVVLTSRGEFGFEQGGIREHMNHLDTHIATCAHYLGTCEKHFISIDYQEFDDERHRRSVEEACQQAERLAKQLATAHLGANESASAGGRSEEAVNSRARQSAS